VCPENSLLEWTETKVEGLAIINMYEPPSVKMDTIGLPYFSRPCMNAGDFNCYSTTWGYRSTNAYGEELEDWTSASGLNLLHDPKQPNSFHSRRWNTSTKPDLAFVNLAGPLPHRTILEPFAQSHHRPSIVLTSQRSGEKRLSQLSQSRTSQWTIPGATGQFRFSVFCTNYLNASFCFDLSLLSALGC